MPARPSSNLRGFTQTTPPRRPAGLPAQAAPLPPGAPLPVADMAAAWNGPHTQLTFAWNRNHNLAGALPDHFRELIIGHDGNTYADNTFPDFVFGAALGRTYSDTGFGGFPGAAYPLTIHIYAIANGFTAARNTIQSPP